MVDIVILKEGEQIRVIEEVYNLDKAREMAEAMKVKAFGILGVLKKSLDKTKGDTIELTNHKKRYHPFWYIKAEGIFEYSKNTEYSFSVAPEVISVKIDKKEIEVDENEPKVKFTAEDHCFEHSTKSLLQGAINEKEKGLDKYLEYRNRKVRDIKDINGKMVEVLPAEIRASFLVNGLVKDVYKPVHADKIITEKVQITQLVLYYRPVWVFEFTEMTRGKTKTIEVDAVTGETKRVDRLFDKKLVGKLFSDQNLFDLTTEIAGSIIPGTGIGLVGAKFLKDRRSKKRNIKKAKEIKEAYKKKNR